MDHELAPIARLGLHLRKNVRGFVEIEIVLKPDPHRLPLGIAPPLVRVSNGYRTVQFSIVDETITYCAIDSPAGATLASGTGFQVQGEMRCMAFDATPTFVTQYLGGLTLAAIDVPRVPGPNGVSVSRVRPERFADELWAELLATGGIAQAIFTVWPSGFSHLAFQPPPGCEAVPLDEAATDPAVNLTNRLREIDLQRIRGEIRYRLHMPEAQEQARLREWGVVESSRIAIELARQWFTASSETNIACARRVLYSHQDPR